MVHLQLYYVPISHKSTEDNLEVVKAANKAPSLYSLVKGQGGAEAIVGFVGSELIFFAT
jgi:hypothetical protein